MKIFRKTHFWQDKRTFMDIDADPPKRNDRGYAEEGSVNIRIGDEEGIKAGFKLSADEARALIDTISLFLKKHDTIMARMYSSGREETEEKYEPYKPDLSGKKVEPESFSIFDSDKEEEEPKLKFYY